jgi:hypothetical protein
MNAIEKILNNGFYEFDDNKTSCIFKINEMEIINQSSGIVSTIKYDENKIEDFNLEYVSYDSLGSSGKKLLFIMYNDWNRLSYKREVSFVIEKEQDEIFKKISQYLIDKVEYKEKYNGDNGIYYSDFGDVANEGALEFVFRNKTIDYFYYNVDIKYNNDQTNNLDSNFLTELYLWRGIDLSFEIVYSNSYNKDIIKVLCREEFIGYIVQDNICELIKKYINDDDKCINSFVRKVNIRTQTICLAIGLYKTLNADEKEKMPHIDTTLENTNGNDVFGNPRQSSLKFMSVGDKVDIKNDCGKFSVDAFTNGTYVDLGEINEVDSKILNFHEEGGGDCFGVVVGLKEINKEIFCTIRVYVI